MESRYRGDPINEPMYEAPDVEEVLPELEGTEPTPLGASEEEQAALPSLDATWSVLTEEPGMDDIMEQAGESL